MELRVEDHDYDLELKVSAKNATALKAGVLDMASMFPGGPITEAVVTGGDPNAATRSPRRRRSAGEPALPAAAPSGDSGSPADPPAEDVGSVGADQRGPDGPVEARNEAAVDTAAAGPGEVAGGSPAAGEEPAGTAALPQESAGREEADAVDEGGRPEAPAQEATLAQVQALAKQLGAKAGVLPVQQVFKAQGVTTPADIDPAKLRALVDAFTAELAK